MDLCKSVVSETCVTRTCLNRKIVAVFVVGILATSIAASFAFNEFMLSGEIKEIKEKVNVLYDADALQVALDKVADKIDEHKGNFDENTIKEIKRDLERIKSKSNAMYTHIFGKSM